MIKIDMWYNDNHENADKISIYFYPGAKLPYRGNIYKDNKAIGDYACDDSVELEKTFSQLHINWDI